MPWGPGFILFLVPNFCGSVTLRLSANVGKEMRPAPRTGSGPPTQALRGYWEAQGASTARGPLGRPALLQKQTGDGHVRGSCAHQTGLAHQREGSRHGLCHQEAPDRRRHMSWVLGDGEPSCPTPGGRTGAPGNGRQARCGSDGRGPGAPVSADQNPGGTLRFGRKVEVLGSEMQT